MLEKKASAEFESKLLEDEYNEVKWEWNFWTILIIYLLLVYMSFANFKRIGLKGLFIELSVRAK